MHCHFLTTSNSSSSGSSSNKQNTKWNCRLPEFLTAGLTPSPCGRYILGGGTSGTCYCWSTFGSSSGSGGELLKLWKAHYRAITCITYSDCGMYVITGGADGVVHLWSLRDMVQSSTASTTNSSKRSNRSSSSSTTTTLTALQTCQSHTYTPSPPHDSSPPLPIVKYTLWNYSRGGRLPRLI